jgi:hypothetical protein
MTHGDHFTIFDAEKPSASLKGHTIAAFRMTFVTFRALT